MATNILAANSCIFPFKEDYIEKCGMYLLGQIIVDHEETWFLDAQSDTIEAANINKC